MGGGEFDVVMISNYETPQWAENGWLVNLSDYVDKTPGYDVNDFIPSLRESLSYEGNMYSVPFYGESSFLMYRKDLFEQAGITMPRDPTWQQVADAAAKLDSPDMVGICLRGKPGWGEVLAPLDTVINTFGGRWFDMEWNAQLTSPEVREGRAVLRRHGAASTANPARRQADSASAPRSSPRVGPPCGTTPPPRCRRSRIPSRRTVVGKVGYALAPKVEKPNAGLAVHLVAGHPEEQRQARRRLEVHLVDDRQELHQAGRRGARLGAGAARQPAVDLRDPRVPGGLGGVRAGDTRLDRGRRSR